MSDFTCPNMERTDKEGLVTCKLGKFGGQPEINVCLKACKGDPDAYLAKVASTKAIMPVCQFLSEDNKTCGDKTVIIDECPKVSGGSCRHYLPGKMPDCGCKG